MEPTGSIVLIGDHASCEAVGAPLARLEARLALETLLRRLPGLWLVDQPRRWRSGIGFRGLEALALRW